MSVIREHLELSRDSDQHKHDHTANTSELMFNDASLLVVPTTLMGQLAPMPLTDWAWRQMFSKLGPTVFGRGTTRSLPYDYLMGGLPNDIRAQALNHHLARADKKWLVRGYGTTVRAVLDHTYSPIGNSEVLEALDTMLDLEPVPGLHVYRPFVGPHHMHLRTVWMPAGHEGYGLGAYIGNDEIGGGRLRILPMVKRTSCDNSLISNTGEDAIEWTHRGNIRAKLTILKAKLVDVLKLSAGLLDQLMEAEYRQLPSFEAVLGGIARDRGWDNQMLARVSIGTEGNQTLFGLVNGVTYAAHSDDLTPDQQTEMELLGGQLLASPDSLFGKAAEHFHAAVAGQDQVALDYARVLEQ